MNLDSLIGLQIISVTATHAEGHDDSTFSDFELHLSDGKTVAVYDICCCTDHQGIGVAIEEGK